MLLVITHHQPNFIQSLFSGCDDKEDYGCLQFQYFSFYSATKARKEEEKLVIKKKRWELKKQQKF